MGYIGDRSAKEIIFTGLKRLEYRGYDSVGVAVADKTVHTQKTVGNTSKLDLTSLPDKSTIGIGHTRWATHGKPSTTNAHPHTFGNITLVHNGIIENYEDLKSQFDASKLQSQTDSEVLAGLIDACFSKTKDLLQATKTALQQVKGTFGLVVMSPKAPDQLIVARRGSPIVIGVGAGQYYIASDATAIIDHTDKVIYLEDDQLAVINRKSLDLYDLKLQHQDAEVVKLDKLDHASELGGYTSYLEKEIFEQPTAIQNVMRGRVGSDGSIVLGGPTLTQDEILSLEHMVLVGCGSAFNAGYYAKYKLEEMLEIPVSVEYASEFRYRYGAFKPERTLAIFLSQSGDTADTLASLREAKRRRLMTMGVVNSIGSTIAREVDHGGIYLHAGVETSVASTKAFTSMTIALLMFGGFLAHRRGLNHSVTRNLAHELKALGKEFTATLELKTAVDKLAKSLTNVHDVYYLGRGELFPTAVEGALKLTEVAYVHAQAFPTGEMKHGPIALVDANHLSVLLLPEDEVLYDKGMAALQEIKAREGQVLTISTRPKPSASDYHLQVAHAGHYTDGLVMNICSQLLALAIATNRGVNIDKPRNLAKSVTVE